LNRTNQSTIIKEAINSYLDKGVTDKQDIYTKVVDELGVPRPTVRRVARDLRTELLQKIQILQSDMPKATTTSDMPKATTTSDMPKATTTSEEDQ